MDIIGTNAVLWSYDIRPTPFYPGPFQLDLTLIALAFMVVYQYCHFMEEVPYMDGSCHGDYVFCIHSHINNAWLCKVL